MKHSLAIGLIILLLIGIVLISGCTTGEISSNNPQNNQNQSNNESQDNQNITGESEIPQPPALPN